MKRIAIVGGGCSGLTAIKCCLDEGLQPVCFEGQNDIGGLWNYSETSEVGKGRIYNSCIINISKEMMAFSDFPPPEHFPMFMPHRWVFQYFRLYAEKFGLLRYILFNTVVLSVVQSDNYAINGRWDVTYKQEGKALWTETFDGVLVCTGHHTFPYQPEFSGLSKFKGIKMHSHSYKDNAMFSGKRVLIVGIGNSAVDIAVDISTVTKQVYISTRRGAWVISRLGFWGFPADAMANNRFLFSLPLSFLEWSVEKMANFRFDHKRFGLRPLHSPLQAHPTINDELPFRLMSGALQIKPNIHEFNDYYVKFDDGSCEEIDAVIFATGYEYKIGIVNESVTKIEGNKTCLYKYMYPPHLKHPTLAVIGLVQAIGAVIPISEMQCRWFTKVIKVYRNDPQTLEELKDALRQEINNISTAELKPVFKNMLRWWNCASLPIETIYSTTFKMAEMLSHYLSTYLKLSMSGLRPGEIHLPSLDDMLSDIEQKRQNMASTYVNSQRHTLQCFWIDYMDQIATLIGVKPNIWKILIQDPSLGIRCLFGPCFPYQYRLEGPGKWDGAQQAIKAAMTRCYAPTAIKLLPKNFRLLETEHRSRSKTLKYLKSFLLFVLIFFPLYRFFWFEL